MDLKIPGFENVGQIYRNVSTPALYEQIVQRREGVLAHLGPVVVRTGQHTGRAPNDKFISLVKRPARTRFGGATSTSLRLGRDCRMATKTLVLLRHGESVWNRENRFTGWTDVGLTDKGHAEAVQGRTKFAAR